MIIYSDPSLTGHDPQLTSPDKYERQVILHDMEELQHYSVPWPVGTLFATIREKFEFELAPSEATDYHLLTEAGLRLYHLPDPAGHWYMDAIGAAGDGQTDDLAVWQTALLRCPADAKLTFTQGRTYLISGNTSFTNDFRNADLPKARNFHIEAYGATIRLRDFGGTELAHIYHNPGAGGAGTGLSGDSWNNDHWEFVWEGGTIDANGHNQHFRHAAELRDGTGSVDPDFANLPGAQEAAQATAQTFGPGGPWEINPAALSTGSGPIGPLILCYRPSRMTVRDVTLKNLAADGFVSANGLGSVRFENCRALNCMPANDQFVVNYVAGGSAPGSQLTAFKVDKPRSRATLHIVPGNTLPAPGDMITGLSSGCVGHVSSVSGDEMNLYDIYGTDDFEVGETLKINATASTTTVRHFRLVSALNATWDGCFGETGNILLGYIDTSGPQAGCIANVENCYAIDHGTTAARFEHAHTVQISGMSVRCAHLCADPWKHLPYGSQTGITIGGGSSLIKISNLTCLNARINGETGRQKNWEMSNITITVNDTDPIFSPISGTPVMITALKASSGHVSNLRISSLPTVAGDYPILEAVSFNGGEVYGFIIDGCQTGLALVERASGPGSISHATDTAVARPLLSPKRSIVLEGFEIEDCRRGVEFVALPDSGDVRLSLRFRRIAENCVVNVDPDMPLLVLDGCLFQDFGLDTSLGNDLRAAIGGEGGIQANMLVIDNCIFQKIDPNCSPYRLVAQNGLDHVRERNSVFVPVQEPFLTQVSGTYTSALESLDTFALDANSAPLPAASTHQVRIAGPDGTVYYIPAFADAWTS